MRAYRAPPTEVPLTERTDRQPRSDASGLTQSLIPPAGPPSQWGPERTHELNASRLGKKCRPLSRFHLDTKAPGIPIPRLVGEGFPTRIGARRDSRTSGATPTGIGSYVDCRFAAIGVGSHAPRCSRRLSYLERRSLSLRSLIFPTFTRTSSGRGWGLWCRRISLAFSLTRCPMVFPPLASQIA